jgi:hypothetical protein
MLNRPKSRCRIISNQVIFADLESKNILIKNLNHAIEVLFVETEGPQLLQIVIYSAL